MSLITKIERQVIVNLKEKDDSTPNPEPSFDWGTVLQLGGLAAAIWYASGWLFATRLLLPFSLSPEEVGITPTWILFRGFLLAYPMIGVLVMLWLLVKAKERLPSTVYRIIVVVVLLIAITYIVTQFIPTYQGDRTAGVFYAASQLGLLAFFALILFWWSHRTDGAFMLAVITLFLTIALLGAYLWNVAADASDKIITNRGDIVTSISSVPVIHVPRVTGFELVGDGSPVKLFPCAYLLGSANGTTVLVAALPNEELTVWRLPTDQTT